MIIFLRHGQAENNTKKILAGRTPGINLTEQGREQAEQAGEMIKSLNISAIYSSPIDRAMQTAEIVGKHCNVKPISDDRLIELDMGKFTMVPYNEIFEKHGNVFLKFYEGSLEISHNGVESFSKYFSIFFPIVIHFPISPFKRYKLQSDSAISKFCFLSKPLISKACS